MRAWPHQLLSCTNNASNSLAAGLHNRPCKILQNPSFKPSQMFITHLPRSSISTSRPGLYDWTPPQSSSLHFRPPHSSTASVHSRLWPQRIAPWKRATPPGRPCTTPIQKLAHAKRRSSARLVDARARRCAVLGAVRGRAPAQNRGQLERGGVRLQLGALLRGVLGRLRQGWG